MASLHEPWAQRWAWWVGLLFLPVRAAVWATRERPKTSKSVAPCCEINHCGLALIRFASLLGGGCRGEQWPDSWPCSHTNKNPKAWIFFYMKNTWMVPLVKSTLFIPTHAGGCSTCATGVSGSIGCLGWNRANAMGREKLKSEHPWAGRGAHCLGACPCAAVADLLGTGNL